MNIETDQRLKAAQESFPGKTMTEGQLKEAMAIADIIHAEIQRSGSFIDKLTDYSHAFARDERFDAVRAESMIRDVYTATRGQSMNQTREGLKAKEEALPEAAHARALECAENVGRLIQDGPTQPFYKAYDQEGSALAGELGITVNRAKGLMKESFEAQGRDLYAHGKELEEAYHKPVREAEIAARKAEQLQNRSQSQSYT